MKGYFQFAVLLGGVLSISSFAWGDSCRIENPITHKLDTWYFDVDAETGEAAVWDVEPFSGDLVIPEKVLKGGAEYPVRIIYPGAFEYGDDFTSVTIPAGICEIGEGAFYGCVQIGEVVIPGSVVSIGVEAFADCSSLSNLTLNAGLAEIGQGAFANCSMLQEIVVPETVTRIAAEAFSGTAWLEGVRSNRIASLPIAGTDDRCAIVWTGPDSPRSIVSLNGYRLVADEAFKGLPGMKGLMIGTGLRFIGDQAFAGCTSLSEIRSDEEGYSIPSHVKAIGAEAFSGCTALTAVMIAEEVTHIGDRAFKECSSLTEVVFPSTLVSIGDEAFMDCAELVKADVPDSVLYVGIDAFAGCPKLSSSQGWTPDQGEVSKDIETLVIAKGVTAIPAQQFAGCTNLTSVKIPETVGDIGFAAFYGCMKLESIIIPEGVTNIGESAFGWCYSLKSITLPSTLKTIGGNAFADCENLTTIYVKKGTASRIRALVTASFTGTANPKPNPSALRYVEVEDVPEDPPADTTEGSEGNPWKVGAGNPSSVVAYVKNGILYVKGSGMMKNFASGAEAPWSAVADAVKGIQIGSNVKIGSNAFSGLNANTPITLPDARQLPDTLSYGGEMSTSASFLMVDPVSQTVTIGVSVKQTEALSSQESKPLLLKAATKGPAWADAQCVSAKMSEDGKTVYITIPAIGDSGFYLLNNSAGK